jgi:hypothetical protein
MNLHVAGLVGRFIPQNAPVFGEQAVGYLQFFSPPVWMNRPWTIT